MFRGGTRELVHRHLRHVHVDDLVLYDGGEISSTAYPGALASVEFWAERGGCDAAPTPGAPMDLESAIPGDETSAQVFGGCEPGGHGELWTIEGGGHAPMISADFAPSVIDFLLSHPKP